MPDELWTEVHDIVQEAVIKTSPRKKECKEGKWLFGEALQIAEKRKDANRLGIYWPKNGQALMLVMSSLLPNSD